MVRDGALIATTATPSFTERGLEPGTTTTYEITSYDSEGNAVATRFVPVTTLGGPERISSLTYQTYSSQALYRTFIADARVSMDIMVAAGCGQLFQGPYRSFGGDNRSYAFPSRSTPYDGVSSRTSVALNVNWDSPAPYDVVWVKEIGETKLYDQNTVIERRTASDSGISITEVTSSSAYAQARVGHDVGNPFCVAGAIKYNVMFRWYRNGTFEVIGWRQPVPHHEIYGGWDNGSGLINWHTFGLFPNEGFGCLTGSCGTRTVNITRSY